jgi:hypothetical protein
VDSIATILVTLSDTTQGIVCNGVTDTIHFSLKSLGCANGIADINNPEIFTISPNPPHSLVDIDYGAVDWSNNLSLHLHITDMLGLSVYAYDVSRFSALHQVDASSFPTGIYVVTITDMQGRMMGVKKLIKE